MALKKTNNTTNKTCEHHSFACTRRQHENFSTQESAAGINPSNVLLSRAYRPARFTGSGIAGTPFCGACHVNTCHIDRISHTPKYNKCISQYLCFCLLAPGPPLPHDCTRIVCEHPRPLPPRPRRARRAEHQPRAPASATSLQHIAARSQRGCKRIQGYATLTF